MKTDDREEQRRVTLSLEQARKIAERTLEQRATEVKLCIDTVEELSQGWLFGYASAKFLETRHFSDTLLGNHPLFVAKRDGMPFFLWQHRSIDESMAAYHACGNPNAVPIPEVELVGWKNGANVTSAIKGIREHTSLGLADAKHIVDRCLGGERCIVRTSDVEQASSMVATLDAAGFKSHVRYG